MITQIAEFIGFEFNLAEDRVVEWKSNIDIEALVHQGVIYMDGNTYTMMI